MTENRDKTLTNLVNASGFLLQLAIEQAVRASRGTYQWGVTGREIPWFDELTNTPRFVDLVLERNLLRAVVECKRSRNADWVFLVSPDTTPITEETRCLWIQYNSSPGARADWSDLQFAPATAEADFCVVRGRGEKDPPMLERLASQLVRAVDSLAAQQLEALRQSRTEDVLVFLPTIVTTARLSVCKVDPAEVSLESGEFPSAAFEEVPAVRFRKSLTALPSRQERPRSMRRLLEETSRTVLVINAEHFVEHIESIRTHTSEPDSPWYVPKRPSPSGGT